MEIVLIICLIFATSLHADREVLSVDNSTSFSTFFDNELIKINSSCMNSTDFEMLTGNVVKHGIARYMSLSLILETMWSICLTELRAALHFGPLRPWQHYNRTEPSQEELKSAPTIEAYYNLIEPISDTASLDSSDLMEKNILPAIAFFDERYPSVRNIFKRRIAEMIENNGGVVDREAIDRWIKELSTILYKTRHVFNEKIYNFSPCWD